MSVRLCHRLLWRISTNVLIRCGSSHDEQHLSCTSQRCVIVCLFFMQHSWLGPPPCLIYSTQARPRADREAFSVKSRGVLKSRPPQKNTLIWLLLNLLLQILCETFSFLESRCCFFFLLQHNCTMQQNAENTNRQCPIVAAVVLQSS